MFPRLLIYCEEWYKKYCKNVTTCSNFFSLEIIRTCSRVIEQRSHYIACCFSVRFSCCMPIVFLGCLLRTRMNNRGGPGDTGYLDTGILWLQNAFSCQKMFLKSKIKKVHFTVLNIRTRVMSHAVNTVLNIRFSDKQYCCISRKHSRCFSP